MSNTTVQLVCQRCRGRRVIETSCSMCHDSTWDHECDDTSAPCPDCASVPQNAVSVLNEVFAERRRQDIKWGEQNHPDVDRILTSRDGGCTPARMAREYEIPSAARARSNCEDAAARSECTWGHIAIEEVAEAIEAATEAQQGRASTANVRKELVQSAAVLVAWIEAIDRRGTR